MEHTDYQKQAQDFLDKTGATLEVKYLKTGKYFDDDKDERDIYNVTLKRGTREYTFTFGQSVNASFKYIENVSPRRRSNKREWPFSEWPANKNYAIPSAYNILACIQKYDPGLFANFCDEFGYDTDSIKAHKTYEAVCDEYLHLAAMFSDSELAEMEEIQ